MQSGAPRRRMRRHTGAGKPRGSHHRRCPAGVGRDGGHALWPSRPQLRADAAMGAPPATSSMRTVRMTASGEQRSRGVLGRVACAEAARARPRRSAGRARQQGEPGAADGGALRPGRGAGMAGQRRAKGRVGAAKSSEVIAAQLGGLVRTGARRTEGRAECGGRRCDYGRRLAGCSARKSNEDGGEGEG
jgi:hypothetical protein